MMLTFAWAWGRQLLAAGETIILKLMWSSSAADTDPAPININVELSKAALSACRCILLYLPHDQRFRLVGGKCGGRLFGSGPSNWPVSVSGAGSASRITEEDMVNF